MRAEDYRIPYLSFVNFGEKIPNRNCFGINSVIFLCAVVVRGIRMAVARWQQANSAKKCKNGRPKTVRNRQRSKTSEIRRKSAKTIGMLFGDRFFQWRYSGGHLGFPYIKKASRFIEDGFCGDQFGASERHFDAPSAPMF